MITEFIKQTIDKYIKNAQLTDITYGVVVKESPLVVRINSLGIEIEEEFLIVPERLVREKYAIELLNVESPIGLTQVWHDYDITDCFKEVPPLTTPLDEIQVMDYPEKKVEVGKFYEGQLMETKIPLQRGVIKFIDIKLKVGQKLILIKASGGQKYYIMDRVQGYDTNEADYPI